MRDLVEAKAQTSLMQRLPDDVPTLGRDMIVLFPKDHHQFPFDVTTSFKTIVLFAFAEGVAVDICCKIAHGRCHSLVQCTSKGEVTTQAHACGTDAAIARLKRKEKGNRFGRIRIVRT